VVPPTIRTSPASTATVTERDMGRKMMSGKILGMV
jgi:hypothetical protein